jgi:peptide/nickel transport system permease protein
MGLLIAKRLAALVAVLIGLATAVFVIQVMIPADPARAILGASASQEVVDRKAHELGYDKPLPRQYVEFMGRLAQGDLQESLRTRNPVTDDLVDFVPATFELAMVAALLAALLGIGVALLLASGARGSGAARLVLATGASMPSFVVAYLGIILLYSTLGLLPASGRLSYGLAAPSGPTRLLLVDSVLSGNPAVFFDALWHLILPATALALGPALALARVLRASLDGALAEDYARTARAKGLTERAVLMKHAFRNALGPMLTMSGLQFGLLLAGVVVVELIFAWPGVGLYMTQAIKYDDLPAIAGVTLVLGTAYVVINFLVDLAQAWADPRIRTV